MALKLGTTALNKVYLGSTEINKAYLGAGVLFSAVAAGLTFVGSRTFTRIGIASTITVPLTSLTDGVASAPRTGDLVVAYVGLASFANRDLTMPSGWTLLATVSSVDSRTSDLFVIYKTMGATPDTEFDLPGAVGSSGRGLAVAIFVYAGASTAAPVFTTADDNNSVLCNPPAITPTVSGSVVISGGMGAHTQGAFKFLSSDFDAFLSDGVSSVADATIGVGRFAWTTGAFDPAAFTFVSANAVTFSWAAMSLVIIPA